MTCSAARLAVCAAGLLAGAGSTVAPLRAQGVAARKVAPRLYILRTAAGSNVLALAATGGTLLVDAGPADGVEALGAALDSLGIGRVRYVVNTHYHDDHIGGNAYFGQRGAVVIARPAARAEAQVDTVIPEFNGWRRVAAAADALPPVTVEGPTTIHLGSDTVYLVPAPGAHTSGDLVVRVAPADVIHTGDVYEVGAYPFIDVWAGGSVAGMIEATRRLLAAGGATTRYVPGHGAVGSAADVERYLGMLVAVCGAVAQAWKREATLDAVMAGRPTASFDDTSWGPARHGPVFAALVFRSLERGSGCGGGTPARPR
jgi:glyoxylase-like metal-dependent hydrolase (beta-lactamase superfamily II)